MVQRHGLTLIFTGALVSLFVFSTLPALEHRERLRRARAAAEVDVQVLRQEVLEREIWLQAVQEGDPFVIERLREAEQRTPDLPGPRYLKPPLGEPTEPGGR